MIELDVESELRECTDSEQESELAKCLLPPTTTNVAINCRTLIKSVKTKVSHITPPHDAWNNAIPATIMYTGWMATA